MSRRYVQLCRLLLVLLMLAVPAATARAEDADLGTLDVVEVRADTFPRIVVRLNASPGRGTWSDGLSAAQFRVIEDGQVQPSIHLFQLRGPSTPSSVVLALDVSGSMADQDRLPQAREAAKSFLAQLRASDRAAIMSFNNQVVLSQTFTNDRTLLGRTIDRLTASGETALYDALARSVTSVTQAAGPNGTRAVVLLTDGQDTNSRSDITEGLRLATQAGVPVYTIGLGADIRADVLQRIADETGGQFYHAPTGRDLAQTFRLISRQLTSRYELYWESHIEGEPGRDVPVQIGLNAGGGATANFSYRLPKFARTERTRPAPSNASQSLTEIPTVGPPSEVMVLMVGLLSGLGITMLFVGFGLRHRNRRLETRLAVYLGAEITGETASSSGDGPLLSVRRSQVSPFIAILARVVMRLLPPSQLVRLQRKLTQAGFLGERHIALFLAIELVLAVLLGGLAYFLIHTRGFDQRSPALALTMIAMVTLVGFYIPYMWLRRRVEARQHELMRALPDALDLMAIGVSAGLSLDGAMLEVVQKWEGELSRELNQLLNEIRMGVGRRQALLNLAERTQLEDIRMLVAALVQSDEIGANVSETLNVQAEQLRRRRRQLAEEKARKAPVKMLIPLIGLIFPSLFVVILAPAMLQVASTLRRLGGGG